MSTTQLTPNWRPTQTQHQDDREQLADAWADDCVEAERELEPERLSAMKPRTPKPVGLSTDDPLVAWHRLADGARARQYDRRRQQFRKVRRSRKRGG